MGKDRLKAELQRDAFMQRRLVLIVGLAAMAGCGSAGPAGPLDSRLYGTWESRRGFVGTDTLDFRQDGSLKVTADDGKKKKSYTAQWYVQQAGVDPLSLNMQSQGKPEFRARRVTFLEDGSFEMKEGSKILGRFQKKSKKKA
jgi:hypothetical protein